MPRFTYAGTDRWGGAVAGRIEAASEHAARVHLEERGIRADSLDLPWYARELGTPRVRKTDLSVFTGLFASLLRSKLRPREALEELRDEAPGKPLRRVLRDVSERVEAGRPLAEALAAHPSVFDAVYCAAVAAGEASGSLRLVMTKLALGLQRTERTRRKVAGALTYPAVVLTIVGLVGTGLLYFIVPQIAGTLIDAGAELPLITRFLLGASVAARTLGPALLVGGLVGGIAFRAATRRSPALRERVDRVVLRIPVVGGVALMGGVARFAHLLAILLAGKTGVVESVRLAAATVANTHLRNRLLEVADGHADGRPLWEEMRRVGLIPRVLITMTKAGEKGASLAEQMESAALHYDEQVEHQVDRLTSILGPAVIVVAFLPVILLTLGIYIPMVQSVRSLG